MSDENTEAENSPVLSGVRILDIATFIAAPFSATLCADLGAEVVKLELPDGTDPLRTLHPSTPEHALHWKVTNRGKRGLTLDIRKPAGREIFLRLLPEFDVLVENFRTGKMDSWGLDIKTLHTANPNLTVLRLTGFGQTGPYAKRPGFARIFEAMSGFANLCGERDGSPQHMNYPMADMVAGLFGAFSIVAALVKKARNPEAAGCEIDLSATESISRLLDTLPVEYEHLGVDRSRAGARATYTVPSNIYRSRDGVWFTIVSSSDTTFKRLCAAMGRPEIADHPNYCNVPQRFSHLEEVDGMIAYWASETLYDDISSALEKHEAPFSKINSVSDVIQNPQFVSRNAFIKLDDKELGSIPAPCVVPRIKGNPEPTRVGPDLGEHTDEILSNLGFDESEIEKLRMDKVV